MKLPQNSVHAACALLLAAFITGCASVPPVDTSRPEIPAAFKEGEGRWTVAAPAEAEPRGTWWKAFSDPVLEDLVERAGRGNTSIQVAVARLAQARALVRAADASRSLQVGVGASAARQGGSVPAAAGAAGTLYAAGADLSYEVDLFGRLAQSTYAAKLDEQAREALLQNTRLLVQAEAAQAYLALRALDAERALVRGTLAAYRDTLRLTERRYQAGDVAELDVARVLTEVAATESEALALDRRRAEIEHALAVLVGEVPAHFAVNAAEWTTALPVIPAGVPATVLARRPDVSAAQRSVLAAQTRVGVAKTAWFPNVSLTGAGGYASPQLGDLLQWSARTWVVGALLSLPVFDGGRRQAGVDFAAAELEVALAGHREQVLVAFREVEDRLSALRLLAGEAEAQSRAVASSSRATVLSDSRYRNGYVSQLELLDARRSELRSRRQALQVRSAQYQATVALIRALGGGWDS